MTFNLMFHHFHAEDEKCIQGSWSEVEIDDLIKSLIGRNYEFLDPVDIQYEDLIFNDKTVLLTFDDALKCQINIAKRVLDKYNIKGIFFIYTNIFEGDISEIELRRNFRNLYYEDIEMFYENFFDEFRKVTSLKLEDVEEQLTKKQYLSEYPFYTTSDRLYRFIRDFILSEKEHSKIYRRLIATKNTTVNEIIKEVYMSKNDVLNLERDGHSIGLHSHTHPFNIHLLSRFDAIHEYKKNREKLRAFGVKNLFSMSHPSGNYNNDILEELNDFEDLKFGFRADCELGVSVSKFLLPRIDCNDREKLKEMF